MNRKPIIGIVGKVEPPIDLDLWNRITLADEFRYLVVKHGAIAMMLLPTEATMEFNQDDIKDNKELTEEEKQDLYTQMEFCDGYILQGGLCSCNYEIEIAKKAIELDKPVIGICAGFNNILRALGTKIYDCIKVFIFEGIIISSFTFIVSTLLIYVVVIEIECTLLYLILFINQCLLILY